MIQPRAIPQGATEPQAMGAQTSSGSRWARAVALAIGGLGLVACVTTYEEVPLFGRRDELAAPSYAVPLMIPIGEPNADPSQAVVAEFYRTVLQRLHEANQERDPGRAAADLEALLADHDREDLPAAMREQLRGYRGVVRGLRFAKHAAANARLVLQTADAVAAVQIEEGAPALGAPVHYVLELPAPIEPVVLGGLDDGDPIGFAVAFTVEDAFVEGSTGSSSTQRIVRLPTAVTLAGNEVVRLPIDIELPGATAVRREIHVRVDLMRGYVQCEAGRSPIRHTCIAAATITQWPVGYSTVAKAPLTELRTALRTFDAKTFARAYLAAAATRGPDRETAIELLIEQVRYGRADQAQVAMAALKVTAGVDLPIGDRDAWLAWWQARR